MINAALNAAMPLGSPSAPTALPLLPSEMADPAGAAIPPPITPAAPPSADPIDWMGEGFDSLPEDYTPAHDYVYRTIAGANAPGTATHDDLLQLAMRGVSPGQAMRGGAQDGVPGLPGGQVDDSTYRGLLAQIEDASQNAPVPRAPLLPSRPTLAQIGVALGAGLLVPRLGMQALAAPFQAQIERNHYDNAVRAQQDAYQQKAYAQRVGGLHDALDAEQRHLGILDNIASRQQIADQAQRERDFRASEMHKARLLGDLHDAGDNLPKLHAAFAALDAAGFGDQLPQESRSSLLSGAQQSNDDRAKTAQQQKDEQAAQSYLQKMYAGSGSPAERGTMIDMAKALWARNNPDDPRIADLEAQRGAIMAPTPKEANDAAHTAAMDANLGARTATENATRAGKVQALLDTHDYRQVQMVATQAQADLAKERTRWIAPEQAAHIAEMESQSAAARARADSTYQGQAGRPSQNLNTLQKNDVTYSNAIDRVTKEVASLKTQRDTLAGLANLPLVGSGHSTDLDNAEAALAGRSADLKRMIAYRDANLQAIAQVKAAQSPTVTYPNGPLTPLNAPPLPPAGAITPQGSGAPPAGWTIKKKGA